ncbi:IS1 family transposase [Microcoleus sp. AT9_B5]
MLYCQGEKTLKNGSTHNKKQKFKCKQCGKQFVAHPTKKYISDSEQTKILIARLLLEKISLAGMARSVGVSPCWLQKYVNNKYAQTPRQVKVSPKTKGKLAIECDELWSFVEKKITNTLVWLAIDRKTREIVGVYIGDRTPQAAQKLWEPLAPVYRQCAVCYTDFWAAYEKVIASTRHKPVDKGRGETNHIERFNNTLRQRVSRLVRRTLSFSKKLENQIGAIWYFITIMNVELNNFFITTYL